jgi:hypothetical protein
MIDVLFKTDYFTDPRHLREIPKLGNSEEEQLFAMLIRDPRFGLGKRWLGRKLLSDTESSFDQIIFSGRADDPWKIALGFETYFSSDMTRFYSVIDEIKRRIDSNDEFKELYKKWLP